MKWKIITFLLLGITIILCLGYLNQKREISKLNKESKVIGKTDTIYLTKEFKPVKEYHTQLLPRYVLFYGSDKSAKNKTDTIKQVSNGDSLVQMLFSKNSMSLSFLNPSGNYFTEEFKLDLDKYQYNWLNGKLTQQKTGFKLKLEPFTYIKYRFLNKMVDTGIGILFKTRDIQYKLGVNGYYYPCLQNKPGMDLELSVTYNFK